MDTVSLRQRFEGAIALRRPLAAGGEHHAPVCRRKGSPVGSTDFICGVLMFLRRTAISPSEQDARPAAPRHATQPSLEGRHLRQRQRACRIAGPDCLGEGFGNYTPCSTPDAPGWPPGAWQPHQELVGWGWRQRPSRLPRRRGADGGARMGALKKRERRK